MKYFLLSALVLIITLGSCSAQIVVSKENRNVLRNEDIEKMPFSALGNMKFIRNDSTKKVMEIIEYKRPWVSTWFFPKSKIWITPHFPANSKGTKDGIYYRFDNEGKIVETGYNKNNCKHGKWIIYREEEIFVEIWKKGKLKLKEKL